jgi:ATP-dependent DNA helicase RecG
VFGAFVQVGCFETGADLIYEDEFHGSLMAMPDEIVDTIYRKYFKGIISYEGLQRIADYPVPRPALREAILNAIVHRDYTTGVPIQIKVFPDSVTIYNDGRLPENWTVANLLAKHRSRPYNPKIAYAFYRAGYIETWGRGIERITTACKEAGKREPLFEASPSEISVTFFMDATNHETNHDTVHENSHEQRIKKLIEFCDTAKSRDEMMAYLGLTNRGYFRSAYIKPLLDSGELKMTLPDKPSSHNQKYIKA